MYALVPTGKGRSSLLLIIHATALIRSASLGLLPSGDASPLNRISYSRYGPAAIGAGPASATDRKSTRLNSSHGYISYAVFCLKKKKKNKRRPQTRRSTKISKHITG